MMNDPCRSCRHLTVRNEFFRHHWSSLFDSLDIHPRLHSRKRRLSPSPAADSELIWAIIESSCDCISVWDRDLICRYANLTQRDILLERLKTEGHVSGFEIEFLRKDGSRGWVQCSARMDAERGYIEGVQLDITAQKVLSPAEKPVLTLIMQGKSNKEIAKLLGRSIRTIEDHRSHMMHKLGVSNFVELIHAAHSLHHTLLSAQTNLTPENGQC